MLRLTATSFFFLAAVLSLAPEPALAIDISDEQRRLVTTFYEELIAVTPGENGFPRDFNMGRDDGPASERPAHRVALKPFYISRYEVPQNLWQAVMGTNPSRWKGPRNSVEMLTWDEANEFCKRMTMLLRALQKINLDQKVRLPTEAEWEYAARAGTTTLYSFGDDVAQLDAHAWSTRNAAGNDPAVGVLKPNAWNLYDVHGYLWEWCADTWHDDYTGAPGDGTSWNGGGDNDGGDNDGGGDAQRVLRGGSWKDPAEQLTSSYRRAADRTLKDDAVGLRCVLQ